VNTVSEGLEVGQVPPTKEESIFVYKNCSLFLKFERT
jgi:hypothetical protein